MTIPGLSLVPLTPEMASERWLGWFRDPDVKQFIIAKPRSVAALRRAARAWQADPRVLALAVMIGKRHLGNVKLELSRPLGDIAELGLLLAPEARGRGIGPEVIRQAVAAAQRAWPRVSKVMAGFDPNNVRSMVAFLKCGFVMSASDGKVWGCLKIHS